MNKTILSLAAVIAMTSSFAAFAQLKAPEVPASPPTPTTPNTTPAAPKAVVKSVTIPSGVFYKGQQVDQYSAKERLLGAKVINKAGEVIGDVEDLIMASGAHKIDTVIIGVGGVLGVGEKKIGVAHKALVFATKDGKRTITLDTTKEILAAVQPYKYAEAPKTMLEKASDATKAAAKRASDATKSGVEKAKEAVKGKTEEKKPVQ